MLTTENMMTSFVTAAWLLVAFITVCMSLCNGDIYFEEGQAIQKRLESLKFDEYTSAVMSWHHEHTEAGTSNLHNSGVTNLRLELGTGGWVNFALRRSHIVDSDTEVFFSTQDGRVKGQLYDGLENNNCFYSGASSGGWTAAFHLCHGLFGLATADGYDYLIHPTWVQKPRRYVNTTHHTVHLFRRRSDQHSVADMSLSLEKVRTRRSEIESVAGNSFVVELGLFSDAAYTQRLQELYSPELMKTVLLTRVAKAQAFYSDKEKVGYDVQIKVKLLEFWVVDPIGYDYQENILNNMESFCNYASSRHPYDVLGLNTGMPLVGDTIGVAYLEAACYQPYSCFASLSTDDLIAPYTYAHEMGHTMGLTHICPNSLDNQNSFMLPFLSNMSVFTPCNKWQLDTFIKSGYADCLFNET